MTTIRFIMFVILIKFSVFIYIKIPQCLNIQNQMLKMQFYDVKKKKSKYFLKNISLDVDLLL